MSDMPDELVKKMDQLDVSRAELVSDTVIGQVARDSFTTCYVEMKKREDKLVDQLKYYSDERNWPKDKIGGVFVDKGFKGRTTLKDLGL